MREELRHIDLIDKHLSGNLNRDEQQEVERLLAEDKDFAKELEVFQQIYQGIEKKENDRLRTKLDLLYKEYKETQEQRPKGLYRRLIIFSRAAAASILLATLFYIFNSKSDPPNIDETPIVVGTDSLQTGQKDSVQLKKKNTGVAQKEDLSKDSLDRNPQDETQFAFSGGESIPSESVRMVKQSSSLSYTFDGKDLTLYGDSSISGLQLQLGKDQAGLYYLKYRDKLFALDSSTTIRQLEEIQKEYAFGDSQNEDIRVKIMPVIKNSRPYPDLTVSIKSTASFDKNYFFLQQKGRKHLVIDAHMDINDIQIIVVSKGEGNSYYLVHKKELYLLNIDARETTPLMEIDFTKNNETRMFMERPFFPVQVYQLNF